MTTETTILFLERELIKLEEALTDFETQTKSRIISINETLKILKGNLKIE